VLTRTELVYFWIVGPVCRSGIC